MFAINADGVTGKRMDNAVVKFWVAAQKALTNTSSLTTRVTQSGSVLAIQIDHDFGFVHWFRVWGGVKSFNIISCGWFFSGMGLFYTEQGWARTLLVGIQFSGKP